MARITYRPHKENQENKNSDRVFTVKANRHAEENRIHIKKVKLYKIMSIIEGLVILGLIAKLLI